MRGLHAVPQKLLADFCFAALIFGRRPEGCQSQLALLARLIFHESTLDRHADSEFELTRSGLASTFIICGDNAMPRSAVRTRGTFGGDWDNRGDTPQRVDTSRPAHAPGARRKCQ